MGMKDRDYYWDKYDELAHVTEKPWARAKRLVVEAMHNWIKRLGL